ncbi:ATP-binding protein, partial [Acidobacteria bacterium AH-259-O06]|nr:ATP-binding protein [Acidobacteria bacterium AH-259-O06]
MDQPLSLDSYQSETDLDRLLVQNSIREGIYFEFKEDYSGTVKQKLGKHVAAFANSHGGLIAIGVKAVNEIAESIPGTTNAPSDLEDSAYRKIASTVNPIPLFATKTINLQSGDVVLLIKVKESAYPPHLFNGLIYVRPAAGSDPVHPDNRAEIDRMYEKSARIQIRLSEAIDQTWYKTLRWPNPTAHLIASPVMIKEDLVPDLSSQSLQMFKQVAGYLPQGCGKALIRSNEFRCQDITGGVFTARITRYGLLEALGKIGKDDPKEEIIFSPGLMEHDLHRFLQG